MLHGVISLARFTLLEAVRSRLAVVVAGLLVALLLAAEFGAGLALTESQSYRTGIYASLTRLVLVLVMVLFVINSVNREVQDRILELTLARPLSRAAWYAGRSLGFVLIALTLAALATLPLVFTATPAAAGVWGISLAAELCLMGVAAMSAALALRQVVFAATATLAFYLLARAIDAIALMSHGPALDAGALSTRLIAAAIEVIALLLPALDRFTRAAWLEAPAAPAELVPLLAQTVIYITVLAAIGLFDLYRMDD